MAAAAPAKPKDRTASTAAAAADIGGPTHFDDDSSGDDDDPNRTAASPQTKPAPSPGAAPPATSANAAAVLAKATVAATTDAADAAATAALKAKADADRLERVRKSEHFQRLLQSHSPAIKAHHALKSVPGLFFVPHFLTEQESAAAFAECCELNGSDAGISGPSGPRVTVFDPVPKTLTTATPAAAAAPAAPAAAGVGAAPAPAAPAADAKASRTAAAGTGAAGAAAGAGAGAGASVGAAKPDLSAEALAAGSVTYRSSFPFVLGGGRAMGPALQHVMQKLAAAKLVPSAPFQVSVNVYADGTHAMVPHKDGSGCQALIVTLGSGALLDFYHQPESWVVRRTQVYTHDIEPDLKAKYVSSVYQPPRGVLVMAGAAFTDYAHAIEPAKADVLDPQRVGNFGLLQHDDIKAFQAGASIARAKRVSIVMWNE